MVLGGVIAFTVKGTDQDIVKEQERERQIAEEKAKRVARRVERIRELAEKQVSLLCVECLSDTWQSFSVGVCRSAWLYF